MDENNETEVAPAGPSSMTLKTVHAAINERGIEMGYSTLSELLAVGDAMTQLNVQGTRGKREFPAETVDILVEFLPEFRRGDSKNSKFAEELKKFLRRRARAAKPAPAQARLDPEVLDAEQLEQISAGALARLPDDPGLSLHAAVEGRARGLAEGDLRYGRLLTAKEAAAICQVSETMLRKTIPAYLRFGSTAKGDRWRLSDIFGGSDASTYKGY